MNIFYCSFQWPAGDQKEENDIEEEEEDVGNLTKEKKSNVYDLYGINSWNYDLIYN